MRRFGGKLLLATLGAVLLGTLCSLVLLVLGERRVSIKATDAMEVRIGEFFREHLLRQVEADAQALAAIRERAEYELRALANVTQTLIDRRQELAPLFDSATKLSGAADQLSACQCPDCSQNHAQAPTVVTVTPNGHDASGQVSPEARELIRDTALLNLILPSASRDDALSTRIYFVGAGKAEFVRMAPWRDLAQEGIPHHPDWPERSFWESSPGLVEAWQAWLVAHPATPPPLTALPPQVDAKTGQTILPLGIPIWDVGRTRCVGGMWCDLPLADMVQELPQQLEDEYLKFLTQADGALLTVQAGDGYWGTGVSRIDFTSGQQPELRAAAPEETAHVLRLPRPKGHQATLTSALSGGKSYLVALHNLPPLVCWLPDQRRLLARSWVLGLSLPQSKISSAAHIARTSIRANAQPLLIGQVAVLLGTAVVLACLVWAVLSRMYGRMRRIAAAVQAISSGDPDAHVPEGLADELGLVARDVNTMAERLRGLNRAAERRNREFLAMLRGLPNTVRVWDPADESALFANEGAEELFATAEARSSRAHALAHAGNPDDPSVWEFQHLATGRSYVVVEHTLSWPDGRRVNLQAAMDVTRQRHSELELRRLNSQLEERVRERTADLRRHVDEADRINRAMVNLLEDLQKSNRDLEQAGRQLQSANRELEAFSYSVSHDLRAPLRSIGGFAEILLAEHGEELSDEARAHLDRIYGATQKMGTLIDSLLTLSRIGRREMHPTMVDLSHVAREVADELTRADPDRRGNFRIQDGVHVRGDERLLRIVLTNLFGNALKFTGNRDDPCIEFGTVVLPDDPEAGTTTEACYVRDNGAGFDMKYYGKLFHPFSRLHKTTQFPGIGIGLTTVQRIIVRHGGRIWAESEPDRGATFLFTLAADGKSTSSDVQMPVFLGEPASHPPHSGDPRHGTD
jgi:signal transduction histidine kinase